MTAQYLKDQWPVIRAKLKQLYPNLTDNDLAYVAGEEEEVFTRVGLRTGLKREEIENALQQELSAA